LARAENTRRAAIQEALEAALNLPAAPARIECFDVSQHPGTDSGQHGGVEDGRMKKSDYRKFIIKTVDRQRRFRQHARGGGAALFAASRREAGDAWPGADRWRNRAVYTRRPKRWKRLNRGPAAGLHCQNAKRSSTSTGRRTKPVVLDRFSPILHLSSIHPAAGTREIAGDSLLHTCDSLRRSSESPSEVIYPSKQ